MLHKASSLIGIIIRNLCELLTGFDGGEVLVAELFAPEEDVALENELGPRLEEPLERLELLDVVPHDLDHLVAPVDDHQVQHVAVPVEESMN